MSSLPGPLAGRKVLIVDDEPYILKIVSFKLRLSGMIPVEATSGEEALRLIREESPDLLLLDVSLTPGLSGFDLCHIVKREKRLQNVPVIFFTAQDSPKDFQAGMDSGAVIYLVKPFKPEKLLQSVRLALLGRPASSNE